MFRLLARRSVSRFLLVVPLCCVAAGAAASEVRLRNGFVIEGKADKLQSLKSGVVQNPGPTVIYPIVAVQTGWQRYFVPFRQIADDGIIKDTLPSRNEIFELPQQKRSAQKMVAELGLFASTTPFDEFGHRIVTLNTPRGPIPISQGITKITPRYVVVTGLSHLWEHGLSLASLDPQILDAMLRKAINPHKPEDRMGVARFYLQAEMYRQAQQELDSITRDFPDLKDRVEQVQRELTQLRARQALNELQRRREAGQHYLAYQVSRTFTPQQVGAAVMRDVKQFLGEYDQAIEKGEKALALLGEYQAAMGETKLKDQLPLYRSIVKEELTYDTLGRLEPFLAAESDKSLTTAEKLALAYSGWILGASQAVTDLPQAARLWDARFLAMEYLRSDDVIQRKELLTKLQALEGVGVKQLAEMVPLLPLPLEAPTQAPGEVTTVQASREGAELTVKYAVQLPQEYNRRHRYPLLVALRPAERTTEQIVHWWGGTPEKPGYTQRRGYIVISPEFADEKQQEYDYSVKAHQIVLESIKDARKRFNIDSDRVYLTGHGIGGDAAFDIGMSHPEEFAGVAPICGTCDEYCRFYWENGKDLAWYVVGGELERNSVVTRNAETLDQMFKHGFEYDVIYAQYTGRGYEPYFDEVPKLLDWMDLHRRTKFPAEVDMQTLRQTDNHFYWLTAHELPRTTVLPQPQGSTQKVTPMILSGRVTPGNTIHLKSAARRHTLWLSPELVDFSERLTVRIKGNQRFNDFLRPDAGALLEDLRNRGDRQKLVWTALEL